MSIKLSTGLRNAMMKDKGFVEALVNGVIDIYSGAQPASADAAETGTKLLRITLNNAAFVAGQAANGLEFETTPANGIAVKAIAEVWSGLGLADGQAGWYRHYDNAATTGQSTSAVRLDGACATSGSQLNMSSTTVVTSAPITIDSCAYTFPAS